MMKPKNIFLILPALLFLMALFIVFQEDFLEFQYLIGYSLSPQYKKDKELIAPYFDEKFYLNHYGDAVRKSGLSPIDHFLKKGWYSSDWRKHTDPNSWFNTTLYQERLWGNIQKNGKRIDRLIDILRIKTNPLVDFLSQPPLKNHQKTVEVWVRKDEAGRAWLAVEGLMRLDRFNVVLHATSDLKPEVLIRYAPQVKRGLKLLPDNIQSKSFFHSDFIRNPEKYRLTDLKTNNYIDPIGYAKQDFNYLIHRVYYNSWKRNGRINPTMINIAHYCYEPLISVPFYGGFNQRLKVILKVIASGKLRTAREIRIKDFRDYIVRIADGFDLCIMNVKLPILNLKIVPGYLATWVNEQELDKNKEFSVSFLLSERSKISEIWNDMWNYKLRNEVWQREKEFKIPTRFYLSYRDRARFPKKLQNRVMPMDSKKFVFNSEFNIAIENTVQEYYFTEKLLGCFASLTVPIYLGCPNIYDYFDPQGMIVVHSLDELIKVTNSLTPKTYSMMLPYLKENKKRVLKLLNLEKEIISEFGKKLH